MHGKNDMAVALASQAGWERLNAYERTKLACAELLRAGEPIPAWTTLRDLIGKGSANDINRAKKDFRREHAAALRKLEGFSAEGVPPSLTPHIVALWQAAIAHAQGAFAEQVRDWEAEVEQTVAAQQRAQDELTQTQIVAQTLRTRVDELERIRDTLQDQVRSEQTARGHAEKTIAELRADLIGQRERLDKSLAHAQTELEKALDRLEAAERRAMMEIERTRQDAAQKVADAEARQASRQKKHAQEIAQLSEQLKAEQARTALLREQAAAREQENRALVERVQRTESVADAQQAQYASLQARHSALLATLAQTGQTARHVTPKKKRLRRSSRV